MEGDSLIELYPWIESKLFYTFSEDAHYRNIIKYIKDTYVLSYCCGWLVVQDERDRYYVINAKTMEKIKLPTPNIDYARCILTRSPTDLDCHVLFLKDDTILCCQPGDKNYTTYPLEEGMHLDSSLIAVVEGKVYYVIPITRHNLVRIECNKSSLQFTKMDVLPSSYNVVMTPKICEYLVESSGELYLVCKLFCVMHPKEYTSETECFLVLRFDPIGKLWQPTYDIGKSTIFIGDWTSISFRATESRIKQNSIYFLEDEYVNIYDLNDHSFSILPYELKRITLYNQEELNKTLDYEKQNTEFLPQIMCSDVSKLVLAQLFTLDPGALGLIRSTCKYWNSIVRPPTYDIDLKYNKYPYLATLINGKCNFFHPTYDHTFCLDTPELLGCYICSAGFGWLLLGRLNNKTQKDECFFFNPSTRKKIRLPNSEEYERLIMSFSSDPTSSECFVVAVSLLGSRIGICKCGEDRWMFQSMDASSRVVNYQPVFHEQKCYCVAHNKNLIVIDLNARKIFQIGETLSADFPVYDECFLVGDGNALLVVFMLSGMRRPQFMTMDLLKTKKEWVPLQNLNNKMIYLSHATCLSLSAPTISTANKIYLPLFRNLSNIFYSLSTGKYHSFFGNYNAETPFDVPRMTNCAWIDVEVQ